MFMMATQARSPRVPTVPETRDLAVFIRTENPPFSSHGDPFGTKWKKAFSHPDALHKSRTNFTTMWHDCTSLIGLGHLFKLDVKELDGSFRPIRAAQKTTSAGSKYMAIKPTQGYRSSTQPRSISHTAASRVQRPQADGSRGTVRYNASPNNRHKSPKYIERADSCVESNKEVVLPTPDQHSHTAANGHSSHPFFEEDGVTNPSSNSKARNSFSARGWDIFETGFAGNQTAPLTPGEAIIPHPRAGSVPFNERPRASVDPARPNSSPQESSRTQVLPSSAINYKSLQARDDSRLTTYVTSGGYRLQPSRFDPGTYKDRDSYLATVGSPVASKSDRRHSPKTRLSTKTSATVDSPTRQSPEGATEKQTAPVKSTPPNRPRRSGTSKSEKGDRPPTTISARPRALSAQHSHGDPPSDPPTEPLPPIPPPQLEVKQDLLLEALPPLDIPAAAAVEEMMTESRQHVKKLKMQHIWPDTPTTSHHLDDPTLTSDEASNLSRLERENARLRAMLYMYVVDS